MTHTHTWARTGKTRYRYSFSCSRCGRQRSNWTGKRPSSNGCPSAPSSGALAGKHNWSQSAKTLMYESKCKCGDHRWTNH